MAGTWLQLLALAAVTSMVATSAAATNHVVGGSTGWSIPSSPSFYSQWASAQTFAVGDTLLFNFTTGTHNVIEVPKSSYDGCSTKNQIGSSLTTGPATVTLTTPGNHYYICGVTGHCSAGQKLSISVASASSSSGPAPAPAPAPRSAAPSSSGGLAPAASSPGSAPGTSAGPSINKPAASSPGSAPASPSSPGTSTGPSTSNPSGNETPTVGGGPSSGGPSTSSAPSWSGCLRSSAIAVVLSATAAFLL